MEINKIVNSKEKKSNKQNKRQKTFNKKLRKKTLNTGISVPPYRGTIRKRNERPFQKRYYRQPRSNLNLNLFPMIRPNAIILSAKDNNDGKEKSYLLTVTANMCRNHLRSARVKRSVSYEEADHENVNASFDGEEADLYEAMRRLPEKYRVVLYLHYYEGYTFREIAGILHITSSAVSMRLHRGRDMLRAELKDFY